MNSRPQPWVLPVAILASVAGAIGLVYWKRASPRLDAQALVASLPREQAVLVYADVTSLRLSGMLDLLAGSKAAEEPDYRKFVEDTGFDYRSDLESAALAFRDGNMYLAARGKFDWNRLRRYAGAQGGACQGSACSMPSSQADRRISFYPLRADVLALALTNDPRGADAVRFAQTPTQTPDLPRAPIWISVPPAAFTNLNQMPAGSRFLLAPLSKTEQTTFLLTPASSGIEAHLEVRCASASDAAALAGQWRQATELLRKMMAREKLKANPSDLSSVLLAGRFEAQATRVQAVWPIDRKVLENLLSGKFQ